MRKNQFRAWVFGGLDEDAKPFMTNVICLKWDFDQWIINWEEHDEWSNQSEYYLMQSTGLKDGESRDGQEIYGGYIVRKHIKDNPRTEEFTVKWDQNQCGFNISRGKNHWYEVIGNIYENKDLLNEPTR